MNSKVRRFAWQWDRPSRVLWASVILDDGTKHSIGFPLSHVVAQLDRDLTANGYLELSGDIDDPDSVDGLLSGFKKTLRSAGKVARKAVKSTTKVLKKAVDAHVAIVRSKLAGYALGAVAVAFPAVGAPALAAQQAAKRALDAYDDAKRAAKAIKAGARDAGSFAALARGKNIVKAIRKLPSQGTPATRMALAAMRQAG
jgi:hypothetical protein